MGILLLLSVLWTCANERAITGGPEDKQAPQILYSSPENESVNVDQRTEIFIKFNEQMKKTSFEASLQIWPRPPGEYQVKSSWTWLKIIFDQPLDSNETYLLTLDKGVQDLRGNGLAATYILAFSTGSQLNAGRLDGSISGPADIKKNGDLLLYRQFDTDLSELRQQSADYVFQPDDKGQFELPYLAERSYMLFYHWDRNNNKLIDGDDYFGRPEVASVWAKSDSVLNRHKIWPQVVPLEKVKLLGVSARGPQFIQLRANRMVTNESLEMVDLFVNGTKMPILGGALDRDDKFAMNLDISSPLKNGAKIWIHNFQDTSGYKLNSDTLIFTAASVYDTLALGPLDVKWLHDDNPDSAAVRSSIQLKSDLPLLFKSDSAFSLVDKAIDSVSIPGSLEKINSMTWRFVANDMLEDGRKYKWEIKTRQLHVPLNGRDLDSLMTGTLRSTPQDSLGSLRIVHMGVNNIECNLTGKGVNRSFRLKPGEAFILDNLPAQSYALVGYIDENGDGRYFSGGMGPAAKAEPFWFFPDEIKIRARWETDLGIWMLNE